MQRFSHILYPIDTKESVLKFIVNTEFKEGENPARFIHKQYCRRSKSKIQLDDFIRLLESLIADGILRPVKVNGVGCYELIKTYNEALEIWAEKKLNSEKSNLELLKLRDEVFDYPQTKARAKSALFWSIVAALSAALTWIILLLQWICSKPS
jgi:hypothetical protein